MPCKELTAKLLDDGVKQFADAFAKLLKSLSENSGRRCLWPRPALARPAQPACPR